MIHKSRKYLHAVIALAYMSFLSNTLSNMQTVHSSSIAFQNHIPKINLQKLHLLLNDPEGQQFQLDTLKDTGGRLGVLEITDLGGSYSNALKTLHSNAPQCVGQNTQLPAKMHMPDGSYRKTYPTTNKTYLQCLDMSVLTETFDSIDAGITRLINTLSQKDTGGELGYVVSGNTIPIAEALQKEHIHVYTQGRKNSVYSNDKKLIIWFHFMSTTASILS